MKNDPKISEIILKCLKDPAFLNEFKKNPKKVFEKEFNLQLDESYQLEVLQETPNKGYVVIPYVETNEFSEDDLKSIAGGGFPNTRANQCSTIQGCRG